MFVRRTHAIHDWPRWDDEVHDAVAAFEAAFGLVPNILLAHDSTFRRIELIASKRNIRDDRGERPDDTEYAELGGFNGPGYHLDFCFDERLATGLFVLIFDDDPDDGDEEPIPEEDTVLPARALGRGTG